MRSRGRMPTGVMGMGLAAKLIRTKPERSTLPQKETWDERSKRDRLKRARLLKDVRAGRPGAADQLWKEYRCRIWTETGHLNTSMGSRPEGEFNGHRG